MAVQCLVPSGHVVDCKCIYTDQAEPFSLSFSQSLVWPTNLRAAPTATAWRTKKSQLSSQICTISKHCSSAMSRAFLILSL